MDGNKLNNGPSGEPGCVTPQQKICNSDQENLLLPFLAKRGSEFYNADTLKQLLLIHHYFADRAAANDAQKVAVILEDQSLSFAEILHASTVLALALLKKEYVKNVGDIVCQCMERSIEMVIGIMSILMAGGVYCPLTVEEPQGRLESLIDECRPSCVMVHTNTTNRLPKNTCIDVSPIILQGFDAQIDDQDITLPHFDSTCFAIVIFTSGSTGKPKGIQMSHRNFMYAITGVELQGIMLEKDIVLQRTPVTFDMHLQDIIGCMVLGSCLVVIPQGFDRDISYILDCCEKYQVSLLSTVPTVWNALVEHGPQIKHQLSNLRIALSSGESLRISTSSSLLNCLPPGGTLVNGYGPAECTLCSTLHVVTKADVDNGVIPIGKPDNAHRCIICDEHLQEVPSGETGELFVSGPAVFSAYLNRPELTATSLIKIPGQSHDKFYRTGDLVRQDPSSYNLYFIGRKDFQVKLRGQRIECGEIEHVILSCPVQPPIRSAVILKKVHLGIEHLVAYAESAHDDIKKPVRTHCEAYLPQYMVPSLFVVLNTFPINTNGKIDRKLLPEPDFESALVDNQGESCLEPPQTATEQAVLRLWQETLNIGTKDISRTSNFFTLSGNSLLLMRLVRLYEVRLFNARKVFKAAKFFSNPTIQEHARLIDEHSKVTGEEDEREYVVNSQLDGPASYSQMSIFADSVVRFRDVTERALANMPFIFRVKGSLEVDRLRKAVDRVVFKQTMLRTRLYLDPETGQLRQKIMDFDGGRCYSFLETSVETYDQLIEAFTGEKTNKTIFNPQTGRVFRCHVIHHQTDSDFVCFNFHHAAADGESHLVFARDLQNAYSCSSEYMEPLKISYIDYAWQQQRIASRHREKENVLKDMEYWRTVFSDTASLASCDALPYDKPPNTLRLGNGHTYNVRLPLDVAEKLNDLARKLDATLTHVTLAGFFAFLFRLTQETDMHIGVPTINRDDHHSLYDIVGSFVNVLPVRCQLQPAESFVTLVRRIKELMIAALTHAQPYMQILHQTKCAPLRILYEVEWTPWYERSIFLAQESALVPHLESDSSLFDIFCCLDVGAGGKDMTIKLSASSDVFQVSTIHDMTERFAIALAELTTHPEEELYTLSILLPNEKDLVKNMLTPESHQTDISTGVKAFLGDKIVEGEPALLHQCFIRRASEDHPQKLAVILEDQCLSYAEFLHAAYYLATHLEKHNHVNRVGNVISQCMEKSIEMCIGIMAILMCGNVYCPLSPEEPDARLQICIDECQSNCVLVHTHTKARFNSTQHRVFDAYAIICVAFQQSNEITDGAVRLPEMPDSSLAVIAFTSGSTGTPKGVCLTHANLTVYVKAAREENILSKNDNVLQRTPVTFSMHLQEIIASLWLGASIVLMPPGAQRDLAKILDIFRRHNVSYAVLTSTILEAFFKETNDLYTLAALRLVLTGGEPLRRATAAKALACFPMQSKLVLAYGQTEAPMDVMHHEVYPGDLAYESIPIGRRPFPGYSAILVDQYLQPVIPGRPGEILISGKHIFYSE